MGRLRVDEARCAEPLEVMDHGPRREPERVGQLLDSVRPRGQQADDPEP